MADWPKAGEAQERRPASPAARGESGSSVIPVLNWWPAPGRDGNQSGAGRPLDWRNARRGPRRQPASRFRRRPSPSFSDVAHRRSFNQAAFKASSSLVSSFLICAAKVPGCIESSADMRRLSGVPRGRQIAVLRKGRSCPASSDRLAGPSGRSFGGAARNLDLMTVRKSHRSEKGNAAWSIGCTPEAAGYTVARTRRDLEMLRQHVC